MELEINFYTFALIILIILVLFLINKKHKLEPFVQVKSNVPKNSNPPMIKPASLRTGYIPQTQSYERDDPISNPKYSPNISPNLPEPSKKLNYPANSSNGFETKHTDRHSSEKVRVNKETRPDSNYLTGQTIDSTPSNENPASKPYETSNTPQPYSEYLEYSNPNKPEPSDYELSVLMEQHQTHPLHHETNLYLPNETNEQIVKKLIKKAAELSVSSIKTNNPIESVQKANYAIGYLDAVKDIMPETEITKFTGVDIFKFSSELKRIQSNNLMNMTNKCPELSPNNEYLLEVASKL